MPLDTPSQAYGTLLYHRCDPLIVLSDEAQGLMRVSRNATRSIKPPY